MLIAILTCGSMMSLTSCSKDDDSDGDNTMPDAHGHRFLHGLALQTETFSAIIM